MSPSDARVRWLSITVEKRFPKPIKVKERGDAILNNGLWNKGMAFDYCERDRLNMRGLLPARVRTFEEQVERQIKIVRSIAPEGAVKQSLYLRECRALRSLPELGGCAALQSLHLERCGALASLPDMSALEKLQVKYLPNHCQAWEQGGRKAWSLAQ